MAVCPTHAIEMRETPAGFLRPEIDGDACNGCGLCYRVCSGVNYHFPLPGDLDSLIRPKPRRVVLASATDPEIHTMGQSGGVVTALLTFMLKKQHITHALVTRISGDGSVRPEPYFASMPEELLESVGSKYCINSLCAGLRKWPDGNPKVAVVGLPCHVHGMRNLQHVQPGQWANRFELIIGLLCLEVSGFLGIDYFLSKRSSDKPVKRIYYRKKKTIGEKGFPSIEYADGSVQDFPESFLGEIFNDKFAPLRCSFCFDHMNQMSDLAVGDPNGFPEEVVKAGRSIVAVYTQRGEDTLKRAIEAGVINAEDTDCKTVLDGQVKQCGRKRRVLLAYGKWKSAGRPTPNLPQMDAEDLSRTHFTSGLHMNFQWRLEAARTRRNAYRRIIRWRKFWKMYSKVRRLFGKF